MKKNLFLPKNTLPLHSDKQGPVAERLGRALQKLVQRFESARDLTKAPQKGAFFDLNYTLFHIIFFLLNHV